MERNRNNNVKKTKAVSKKQIRRKRRRRILIIELFLLLMLLGILFVWNKFRLIQWNDIGTIGTNSLDKRTEEILKGYTTVAIFGVDNRTVGDYKGGNSDSIMVCSIDNDTKEVRLMSVFRDTYLDVGKGSFKKCNAAYSNGGPEQAMKMLNKNLDLDIQNYVAVDFKAVVDAVDAVGGIELEVLNSEVETLNMYIPEIEKVTKKSSPRVSAGYQTLNGVQALAYCRIRYTAGDDFRRAQRQRTVLSLLVDKAKSSGPVQLNSLVDAIFPEVSTSLSLGECLELAAAMSDYEITDNIGWPTQPRTAELGSKGSVVVPCTLYTNVSRAHEFLYKAYEYEPTEEVKSISDKIKNETGFDADDAIDYITWENK